MTAAALPIPESPPEEKGRERDEREREKDGRSSALGLISTISSGSRLLKLTSNDGLLPNELSSSLLKSRKNKGEQSENLGSHQLEPPPSLPLTSPSLDLEFRITL